MRELIIINIILYVAIAVYILEISRKNRDNRNK
jgi:hypothetical protein